jgi:hypothetical protein
LPFIFAVAIFYVGLFNANCDGKTADVVDMHFGSYNLVGKMMFSSFIISV